MTKHIEVLYRGAARTLYNVSAGHGSELTDFLDERSPVVRARFHALFRLVGDQIVVRNIEKFREIGSSPKVFEFKVHHGPGWRVYAVQGKRGLYLTHGSKKRKPKRLALETRKAVGIFERT